MQIRSFTRQYQFLSNFYHQPEPMFYLGLPWHTVEHAFQAAKSFDPAEHLAISRLRSPADAKKAGRRLSLRPDWNDVREAIMLELLRLKFSDPQLRDLLNATGDRELIEGNTWGDTFWGVCRGAGQNKLGKLLMQVRAEGAAQSTAS